MMIMIMVMTRWWCGCGGDSGDCGGISDDDDGDDDDDDDDKLTRLSDFVNPVIFGISHYKKLQDNTCIANHTNIFVYKTPTVVKCAHFIFLLLVRIT